MAGRRRSTSELPRAPLELLHPLAVQGGEVPAADILGEPLGAYAATAHTLLRAGLAWSADPARADDVLPAPPLRRMEEALLRWMRHDPAAAPFAVLAGALATAGADRSEAARACLCISDWALERGATHTALAYAQLAALVWPRHARYAWIAARLLRAYGRVHQSEGWFRRAQRVAAWTDDYDVQAKSLTGLGTLYCDVGRFPGAHRLHHQALRVARRHALHEAEAITRHNLFVYHAQCGPVREAERYAGEALRLYGREHPGILNLVHDVAQFWTEQGFASRSLPLFTALLPSVTSTAIRMTVVGGATRAAGAAGARADFEKYWAEMWELAELGSRHASVAAALYEGGVGAACVGEWERARLAFHHALEHAQVCLAHDVVERATRALEAASRHESVDNAAVAVERSGSADRLALSFVESLSQGVGQHVLMMA